jgi:hypothetical protein
MGMPWNVHLLAVVSCGLLLLPGCAPAPDPASAAPLPTGSEAIEARDAAVDPDTVPLADLESDLDYQIELSVELDDWGGIETPVLTARVIVTNVSPGAIRLEHSGCSLRLEAHRPGGEATRPLWHQARSGVWPTGPTYGCPLPLLQQVLQPRESYDGGAGVGRFGARVPVAEVYGDSLPTGRYVVTAVLHANRDSVRLPAGEAFLPTSPFRLGAEYPMDGFHYSVESGPVGGSPGTYEVRVVVRNAGLRPDLTRYLRSQCPVVLHAYATAETQRTAPPAPVWMHPRQCGPEVEPMRLTGDQTRVLTHRFTAPQVLGDSLPPGRYHVTAIVMLGREPGPAARRVWLDAGALDLR